MGRLAGAPANIRYFVQAVNGVGLVAIDDNRGWYYAFGAATPAIPAATTPALVSPPTRAAVGDSVDVTTRLTFGGVPVAGRVVTIAIGGVAQIGMTASDGSVTVRVPAAAVPGTYQMTVSFAGDDVFQPSSTTSSFVIDKAPASLVASPVEGATLTGTLGGQTVVLQQENVTFTVEGPDGSTTTISGDHRQPRAGDLPALGASSGNYTVPANRFRRQRDLRRRDRRARRSRSACPKLAQEHHVRRACREDDRRSGFRTARRPRARDSPCRTPRAATARSPATRSISRASGAARSRRVRLATRSTIRPSRWQQSFAITVAADPAPTVVSLVRAMPSPTMVDSVNYTLTFSEAVTGVAAGNFAVVPSGITARRR